MKVKLVVARYNEDVSWINMLPSENFPVLIYNKGDDLEAPRKGRSIEIVKLPNIGREQYTFYHHIYHNYDNLDDYTAFLQGGVMDHVTRTLYDSKRKEYFNAPGNAFPAALMLVEALRPQQFSMIGAPFHSNNPMQTDEMTEYLMKARKILFPDLPDDFEYYFGAGGMFVASKHVLRKYSRSFYKKILDMWDNSLGSHSYQDRKELVEDFLFEHFNSFMYTL